MNRHSTPGSRRQGGRDPLALGGGGERSIHDPQAPAPPCHRRSLPEQPGKAVGCVLQTGSNALAQGGPTGLLAHNWCSIKVSVFTSSFEGQVQEWPRDNPCTGKGCAMSVAVTVHAWELWPNKAPVTGHLGTDRQAGKAWPSGRPILGPDESWPGLGELSPPVVQGGDTQQPGPGQAFQGCPAVASSDSMADRAAWTMST